MNDTLREQLKHMQELIDELGHTVTYVNGGALDKDAASHNVEMQCVRLRDAASAFNRMFRVAGSGW